MEKEVTFNDLYPELKESQQLKEYLENATKNQYRQLLIQSKNDEWLKTLLNSYVKNTHIRYAFAETDQAQNAKVGSIIKMVSEGNTEYKGFFSKKINAFTAFISYKENASIIDEIKIFSLTKGKTELAKDLIDLIDHFLKDHSVVKWSARSDNIKAIKHYNTFVKHKFGQEEEKIQDKIGLIHYSVP